MSFPEFKTIIDGFLSLRYVTLVGIGSSFLNKDFLRMLAYLRKGSTVVEVVDTLNHVDYEQLKKFVEIGPDVLLVSILGGTKESYGKICPNGDFDRVINNLKDLITIKKEMKTPLPILNFHFMVTKSNVNTIGDFLEFVNSLETEVGDIVFSPVLHEIEEIDHENITLDKATITRIERKSRSLNLHSKIDKSVISNKRKPVISNCIEWIMPFILATGHITPCCLVSESNQREFQKRTSLGNAFNTSIRDIWEGDNYVKYRKMIQNVMYPCSAGNARFFVLIDND